MSLINDALKDARRDAGDGHRGNAGPTGYQPPPRAAAGGRGLLMAVMVAGIVFCLILVGVGTVFFMLFTATQNQARDRQIAGAAAQRDATRPPAEGPITAPAPEVVRPVAPPPNPSATPAVDPPPAPEPDPEPGLRPDARPPAPTPPAPETGDEQGPATRDLAEAPTPSAPTDAPPEIRRAFDLKGIMKARSGNLALINSRVARVGDTLQGDARIVKITDSEVVLRVDGVDYRLVYNP